MNPEYGALVPTHIDPHGYPYEGFEADPYMYPLPFAPSSASHGLVPGHPHTRSPSRFPQYTDEAILSDAPPMMSSQSFPDHGNVPFVDAFLGGAVDQQPDFSLAEPPAVTPVVVRKKPSGYFKVLERFQINPVSFNFNEVIDGIVNNPAPLSTMWSGILTGSKYDRNYQTVLLILERVFTTLLDDTVRRLRDEAQVQQLAVFLRQIWTAVLPVYADIVEKWIVEYHNSNSASFFKDLDTDDWDEEDEAREKRLDELDQEIEELQAEIEAWERISRNYPGIDSRAVAFAQQKLYFVQRLGLTLSVPTETATCFVEGGKMGYPTVPEWEHPEIRRKRKIRDVMTAGVAAELNDSSLYQPLAEQAMGIPANGFCFEPGVVVDPRWGSWTSQGWDVELPEYARPTSHHRLSLDALSAFN